MENTEKTQSNDATTKTDNKTVASKAGTAPQSQGENKEANQGGRSGGAQTASATDVKSAVSDTVGGATDAIKDAFGQAKETGGAVASQAYGIAAKKATEAIDEKKADLTQGLTSVADTIRQIGGNLSEAQEPTGVTNIAAQYTNQAADKVEQLTGYLERRDFKGLVRDLEDLAHKNPAIFLGGAFAIGILAARFFKSGTSGNAATRRTERSMENSGGTRVRQLRRKSNGRTDTLNTGDDASSANVASPNMTSENRGG